MTRRNRVAGLAGAMVLAGSLLAVVGTGEASSAAPPKRVDGCGGERPVKAAGGRYRCTFEDDFDGATVDRSKWVVQDTSLSGVHAGDRGCYVDDPANVAVAGGVVRLTSRLEPEPFVCHSPTGDFETQRTAATIGSWNRFNQTYGRFEFRARFPDSTEPGLHSALWLYPQKHTYGGWPNSGEIDVAEWFSGAPAQAYPSVHYAGEDWRYSTGFDCPVPGASTAFHRYAVEWTPSEMRFLYDGNECFRHSWTPRAPLSAPQPFDQPFYVVLTQVFGGDWNAYTDATPTSATLEVDWVRVWS